MPDTLRDDISLVIGRHVLHLTDAAAKQLDIRDGLRPAVERIIILVEAREAALRGALKQARYYLAKVMDDPEHHVWAIIDAALATVKGEK